MPRARTAGPRHPDRRAVLCSPRALSAALVVATLVAACGPAGVATPAATAPPASPPPTAEPLVEPTAVPTALVSRQPPGTDELAGPPAAVAAGIVDDEGRAVVGALGTFSWDDAGSDAPWIVPRDGGRVAPAAAITIEVDPARAPVAWTARWARVEAGGAGLPLEAAEGAGAVMFAAPSAGGTWSLQLDARFAQGRGATWYWRVEVVP